MLFHNYDNTFSESNSVEIFSSLKTDFGGAIFHSRKIWLAAKLLHFHPINIKKAIMYLHQKLQFYKSTLPC